MIEFMLVVSTETNRVDVLENSQKDAAAKMDLSTVQDSQSTKSAFTVVKDIATEKAKEQRDKIVRFLGSAFVDDFKPRMCVTIDITESEAEGFSVNYTPLPIRFDNVSDEGIDCLNRLEIWFLVSMALTLFVSFLALIRAWAHRYDFKKVISPRYKWFGINHGGPPRIKHSHVPLNIFASPCHCFDYLGLISNSNIFNLNQRTKNQLIFEITAKMTPKNTKMGWSSVRRPQEKPPI